MANYDGSFYSFTPAYLDSTDMGGNYVGNHIVGDAQAVRFKMRGKNALAAVVTWVVAGEADTTASQYTGGNTPITDISVAVSWDV